LDIYQSCIRPLIFNTIDPEVAHQSALKGLHWLADSTQSGIKFSIRRSLAQTFACSDARLNQQIWDLPIANPVGLAAGFDKDGLAAPIWPHFGFGFAELGTVTLHPQLGNPRPRLFRLPADRAVLNRMGFNNLGAAALARQLQAYTQEENPVVDRQALLGINLGKSKITPLAEAASDYVGSFRLLQPWGDYFVVNVSSPNTPGLRSLQAADQLAPILDALQAENQAKKPLLIKIAPDLAWDEISDVLTLVQHYQLAGIIATNTTIRRDHLNTQRLRQTGQLVSEEAGGISGAPLHARSTEVIRFIWQQTQGKLPIVGVGGIFTAEDAWEKITAGASLIQVYTGWIYEGPWMVKRILSGLLHKLEAHKLPSIASAVGWSHSQTEHF
jgi:dihydroorotate dehydrogenase